MEMFRSLIGPDEGADAAQLCVRAVLLFAFGILCVRIAGRRTFAHYSPLDIVVALIVGSNISRVMMGKAAFWPSLAATLTPVVLHRIIASLTLHWGPLSWLTKARPIEIVRDGVVDERQMRRAGLSRGDLYEALRMEQAASPGDAALATLEASGKVSVIPRKRES
jgi:uncharacterized membrane protein YcaP (DUF421 family)